MTALTRIRRGWHLGFQSLRIVFRDKTLLLFPMIPITLALAVVTAFMLVIGADQLFWALFMINSLKHVRYLAIGYALVAAISVFFAAGLVTCTRITLEERDSKLMDGLLSAGKRLHWLVLWALISWSIGPLLNLLDHLRYTSPLVRRIVKTNWSQLSFFLLPVLIMENINVFSAVRRTVDTTGKTWGTGAVSQLGLLWFFAILNIPTLLCFGYGHYLEGPWPRWMTFVVLTLLYFTVVLYQTASTVLGVVLYKFAASGDVVEGFNADWMKEAFVRPKVYVLVKDDPNDAYVPLEDIPAPEGVDPQPESTDPGDAIDDGGAAETPPAEPGELEAPADDTPAEIPAAPEVPADSEPAAGEEATQEKP